MRRSLLSTVVILGLGMFALAACASGPAPTEPNDSPTASPVSYPIPNGCPSSEAFGEMFVNDPAWAVGLDATLVSSQLSAALPPGGCAYAKNEPSQAVDGTLAKRIIVAYFNVGTPGHVSEDEFVAWAQGAGGVAQADHQTSFDLPRSFSGWDRSTALVVDGESAVYFSGGKIPEYTQGAHGSVDFWLAADRVDALVTQSASGQQATDPATLLASGLATRFGREFEARDKDGYTVRYTINGSLNPFDAEVRTLLRASSWLSRAQAWTAPLRTTRPSATLLPRAS